LRQRLLTLALFSLFLFALPAFPISGEFMAADELSRGMRGVGRTVFQGTSIDSFAVEILGVVHSGLGPRQDLILARLSGGPLAETGIIKGMSGSPVYVEGRLIGAVAYGWTFSKQPICGITPIHQMLRVMERDMGPPPAGSRAHFPLELDADAAALVREAIPDGELPDAVSLEPLATPVWVAGMTPLAGSILGEILRPFGLQVMAAPGGREEIGAEPLLEPGSPLGVQLISGDLSATGIGTLTYIDGERIVGFGHPMMLAGAVDMPMTGAYIYDIIPSQVSSFKIGAATRAVGAIRQDRAQAIAGVLGRPPDMLPVAVDIAAPDGDSSYRFGIVRHQELIPGLARSVLLSALEASEKLFGEATLELGATIHLSDGRTLDREQVYSGSVAILVAALESVRPLDALVNGPFTMPEVDSLRFSIALRERITAAGVRSLRVDRAILEAGDTLAIEVGLQPYRLQPLAQRVEIPLPADLAPGELVLRVGSGGLSRTWETQRRPDLLQPRDGQQLLELLAVDARDDELIVELYRSEPGLAIDGRELPGLPPSARAILEGATSSGHFEPVHGQVVLRRRVRTDYVLSGEQALKLEVRKPRIR
jgi:hypothetical protein